MVQSESAAVPRAGDLGGSYGAETHCGTKVSSSGQCREFVQSQLPTGGRYRDWGTGTVTLDSAAGSTEVRRTHHSGLPISQGQAPVGRPFEEVTCCEDARWGEGAN